MNNYQIRVFNADGEWQTTIWDFVSLDYARSANQVGNLELVVDGGTYGQFKFDADWTLEVWRQPDSGAMALDGETIWFVRLVKIELLPDGSERITIQAKDTISLLERRICAWYATDNPVPGFDDQGYKTSQPDQILIELFDENFGDGVYGAVFPDQLVPPPSASSPTRRPSSSTLVNQQWRTMPRYDKIQIGPSLFVGPVIAQDCAWQTILGLMQNVCETSAQQGVRIYFDIVYTPTMTSQLGQFEFRVWYGQRGSIRPGIVMSPEFGTISDVILTMDYSNEATWVHVGGENQGALRTVVGVVDPVASQRSRFYPIEAFIDYASDDNNTQGAMEAAGAAELRRRRGQITLAGNLVQSPDLKYGIQYKYGDVFQARFKNYLFDARLDAIHVTVNENGEQIQLPLTADGIGI